MIHPWTAGGGCTPSLTHPCMRCQVGRVDLGVCRISFIKEENELHYLWEVRLINRIQFVGAIGLQIPICDAVPPAPENTARLIHSHN